MKTLLSMLVVLAVASPLCASTVLLQEDFEGAVGTKIYEGYNGWQMDGVDWHPEIVADVIDSGHSLGFGGGAWLAYPPYKTFTHTPVDEVYTFTAVITAGSYDGASPAILLDDGDNDGVNRALALVTENANDTGSLLFFVNSEMQVASGLPASGVWDVKFVLTDERVEGYYRVHGTSTWNNAIGVDVTSQPLSVYNTVWALTPIVRGACGPDKLLGTIPDGYLAYDYPVLHVTEDKIFITYEVCPPGGPGVSRARVFPISWLYK